MRSRTACDRLLRVSAAGSEPRLIAIVNTQPSPRRQRASAAALPIARESSARAPTSLGTISVPPHRQQPAIEFPPLRAARGVRLGHRSFECRGGVRIGDRRRAAPDRQRPRNWRTRGAAPRAPRRRARVAVVGEEQERRAARPYSSPMNSSGICGDSNSSGGRGRQRRRSRERRQPLAERAVADLVMVLQEQHESGRRQIARSAAARLAAMGDSSP